MHVVRHHDEGVHLETSQISVLNSLHHNIGDFRLLEKERTSAGVVKNAIHSKESLSRSHGSRRKASISRQTSVQPPSEKNWLTYGMKVRQTPPMDRCHKLKVDLRKTSQCGASWKPAADWQSAYH